MVDLRVSGNLALEICFILSFVSLCVILFEPNKYLLLLQKISSTSAHNCSSNLAGRQIHKRAEGQTLSHI